MNTRTHVIIPHEIATEIDTLVGKRGRSQFLTDAATKELVRLRQRVALKNAIGASIRISITMTVASCTLTPLSKR